MRRNNIKAMLHVLSDVYSLGATLHHILTRKDPRLEPPFSFAERPIHDFNPAAPDLLVQVVEKALSFEPQNRFQSCVEMKPELEKLRYKPRLVVSNGGTKSAQASSETPASSQGLDSHGTIEPRWKFKAEDEIRCTPAAYKEMAFIGSYDTNV